MSAAAQAEAYAETRREPAVRIPGTVNPESRTCELIVSTGARVRRWINGNLGWEELDIAGATFRDGGAPVPLIDTHNAYSLDARFGLASALQVISGRLVAAARFDKTPKGEQGLQLAQEGCAVSFGYRVDAYDDTIDPETGETTRRVTAFTVLEITLCPIGADPGAHVRGYPMSQSVPVPAAPVAAPAGAIDTRRAEFQAVARAFHLTDGDAIRGAMNFQTAAEYRTWLIDERAAADLVNNTSHVIEAGPGRARSVDRSAAIAAAIAHRMDPTIPLPDDAREFRGLSLLDLARDCLELRGERGVHRVRPELVFDKALRDISAGHGTGDFPLLMNTAGARVLRAAYERAASPMKSLAAQKSASDFRPLSVLRLGEHPNLKEVNEHGEIENVTLGEAKESYRLRTYANIFTITRQALINDDLGAFAAFAQIQGSAAAETETALLVNLLVSNPAMSDNLALFHADHGNLAGSGGAIGESTLSTARIAMRTQKGVDGIQLAPATPKTLLVGPAKETEAEKQLAALNAAVTSNVNPFAGRLELAVEPRLTGNGWYLFADPAVTPVLEYAYLNGHAGPQLAVREGWRTLGTEFRVVHDFGCGATDWRGAYKNAGA